jgi:hypothetical protein
MYVTEDGPIFLNLKVTVKGAGDSPAVGVRAWPSLYAGEPGLDVVKSHEEKCRTGRNEFPGWETLFPGEISTHRHQTSMDAGDAKLARPHPSPDSHYFTAFLIVCASYRAANSSKLHTTSSLYMLQKETSSGPPEMVRIGGYAEHARQCLERARSATSLPLMAKFQSLAHSWLRLAEDLERAEALVRRLKQPERKAS